VAGQSFNTDGITTQCNIICVMIKQGLKPLGYTDMWRSFAYIQSTKNDIFLLPLSSITEGLHRNLWDHGTERYTQICETIKQHFHV